MNIFSHSGSLGDIIYSLPVVKHFGGGEYVVKLRSTQKVVTKYGDVGLVDIFYRPQIDDASFAMLQPLLESQSYISKAIGIDNFEYEPTHDLDKFRGVMWRSFRGNYLEGYFKTFNISYEQSDLITPWLEVEPNRIAKFVVGRTFRYRNESQNSIEVWNTLINDNQLSNNGIFVGLKAEHEDFEKTFGVKISYHKISNFLELAAVISGCDAFVGNQTFSYSLAQGLGKTTVLETKPNCPLNMNECFFPRTNCYYF
jgi:hypothetical protein